MPTKRVRERLAWLAFALAAAASAIAQEPRQWLERMNQALTSRNYDGVFAHWQDGRVEMLRIIHRNVNGQVTERLASLDDHAVGKIDLSVFRILGEQTVPVAGIERRKVLVEHRLRRRLLFQVGQFHLRLRSRSYCNDGDCRQQRHSDFHIFLPE